MESKVVFLGGRLLRGLRRLGFFPFTLFYAMLNATVGQFPWWWGRIVLRVGEVTGEAAALPRSVMLWLERVLMSCSSTWRLTHHRRLLERPTGSHSMVTG